MYPPRFNKLDNLTSNMLSPNARSPKLRCYGSEANGLVPVARHLAEELLVGDDVMAGTIKQATLNLCACYDALSSRAPADQLSDNCRKFCTLWVALEEHEPEIFRIKPKMHLMQELCEMEPNSRPSLHWTYRDEEFGGTVAALGRRLGGPNTAASVGVQTLLKFCALHKVPTFV